MSSKIKFYYDLMSQPSRALYIFLNLAKIPHEAVAIAIRNGEHLSDEFKEVNRFKKLPCITDGDFKLSESVAILRYLDALFPIPEQFYPKDAQERARIDEYLEWQHLNTRMGCANAFRIQVIHPLLTGKPPNPAELKAATKYRERILQDIEEIWLAKNKYIVGDKLTVADLFAACEIEQTRYGGYEPSDSRPKLGQWLKQVKADSDPIYSQAHKYIAAFGKKVKL